MLNYELNMILIGPAGTFPDHTCKQHVACSYLIVFFIWQVL